MVSKSSLPQITDFECRGGLVVGRESHFVVDKAAASKCQLTPFKRMPAPLLLIRRCSPLGHRESDGPTTVTCVARRTALGASAAVPTGFLGLVTTRRRDLGSLASVQCCCPNHCLASADAALDGACDAGGVALGSFHWPALCSNSRNSGRSDPRARALWACARALG